MIKLLAFFFFGAWILVGCKSIPSNILDIGPQSSAVRKLQTRQFEGLSEEKAVSAGIGVMQDLGFILNESSFDLGVVIASKDRNVDLSRKLAQSLSSTVLLSLPLFNIIAGTYLIPDERQEILATFVVRSVTDKNFSSSANTVTIRVNFSRKVFDKNGFHVKSEILTEPALYQGFFEVFNRAVFLEGQEI